MPNDKLSAREAALLAQVRAELGKDPAVEAEPAASAPLAAGTEPVAPGVNEPEAPDADELVAPGGATPAPAADPAQRVAALMAAARAETERLRRRRRQLYVWAPFAFMSVVGLWALLWLWHRL